MAGQSDKKNKSDLDTLLWTTKLEILIISIITGVCYLYNIFINGYELAFKDISIVILSIINYICYKALGVIYKSMWEDIIKYILILNLVIMLGINYSYKFWWIYAVIPLYYSSTAFNFILGYVKGIGKSSPEDVLKPQQPKAKKPKMEVVRK